jgi:hypothetical protein
MITQNIFQSKRIATPSFLVVHSQYHSKRNPLQLEGGHVVICIFHRVKYHRMTKKITKTETAQTHKGASRKLAPLFSF